MAEKEKKQSVQTIQTKTRVEKGKSSIASVIFGRTGIIILLILLLAVPAPAAEKEVAGIHVSAGQDVFHRFCREGGSSYSCYLLNK